MMEVLPRDGRFLYWEGRESVFLRGTGDDDTRPAQDILGFGVPEASLIPVLLLCKGKNYPLQTLE